jgi:putative FmdB family regulatory protein
MPTYEYRCPTGHEFEVFQRMSDEPVADCPECGEASTRLLSAGGGFLFKGDGFYITDYRSDAYRAAAKKESGAGGASAGSTSKGGAASPGASSSAGTPSSGSGGASAGKGSASGGTASASSSD